MQQRSWKKRRWQNNKKAIPKIKKRKQWKYKTPILINLKLKKKKRVKISKRSVKNVVKPKNVLKYFSGQTNCKKKVLVTSRKATTDFKKDSCGKKNEFNSHLQYLLLQQKNSQYKKLPLKLYDKVFYYYMCQTPLNMYAHKAFILLEMQLNIALVRAKLVPYLFMVHDLCFYRLVHLNQQIAKNPYQILSLYDSLSLPVYLHNYMYYRQYRIQYYPANIGKFFKNYWVHFTNYTNNKVWLLANFVTSDITAEAITFDYPNIIIYMGPFRRFTKLYYRNQPYAPAGQHKFLNHTHSVLKLKLFEYAAFYR